MFCTNCGASNENDAKFCVNCAESQNDVQLEEKLSRARGLKNVSVLKKVSFLQTLFDFSFRQFVSPRMMKFLYSLSMIFAGLIALLLIIIGFEVSAWFGIFALLIGAPLLFLLTVIFNRVILEMVLVIFRMADCMENIRLVNIEERPDSRDGIQWNV